jgi:dTDP-4-dehydrorhamnose reductase
MLGSYLPSRVVGLSRSDLDVTVLADVERTFNRERPSAVIHLAAATNVDRSQEDRDYAFTGNVLGTLNVAITCRMMEIPVLYVSTGGVFDGGKEAFAETDLPAPVNFYAWTKYEGERIISELVPNALILRAGWVMGGGPRRDHKFIGGLVKAFRERGEVRVVNDRYGSPTYARHFVDRALQLLDQQATGIWHCANEGVASRFDVATAVAAELGYRGALIPISSSEFMAAAPRGRSEGLICTRLRAEGLELPPWRDAVHQYLREFSDA